MPPDPIDTTKLGPIRVDASADQARVDRARACLGRHLPSIAAIPANEARAKALSAMLEFEASERTERNHR
jgi:hypothetical protein